MTRDEVEQIGMTVRELLRLLRSIPKDTRVQVASRGGFLPVIDVTECLDGTVLLEVGVMIDPV
jgi:hypothetical protein